MAKKKDEAGLLLASTGEAVSFDSNYYNADYYVTPKGKKFRSADGQEHGWSYDNPTGEFLGADPIAKSWKTVFNPKKMLDVGCGRGTFVTYARDSGIDAVGFDFSDWAVSDEGRYSRCKKDWVRQHDATKMWPYEDKQFDLVTCLDLLEHIYEADLDFVIDEMYRVSKKYVFIQLASLPDPSKGICFNKGDVIPVEWEGCAVAGHVCIQSKQWWMKKLYRPGWAMKRELLDWFIAITDPQVIANWLMNTVVVMERTK